jgi:hypothetical protein
LLTDAQDKTLRDTLDQAIKDGQPAQKKGQTAPRPSTPKK